MGNSIIVYGKGRFFMTDYDNGYNSAENEISVKDVMEFYPEAWEKLQDIVANDKQELFNIFKEQTGAKSVDFEMDNNGVTKMTYIFNSDVDENKAKQIIEYTIGQYSDGWGEGLEQEELYTETETYTETEEDEDGEEYEEEYETEYILTFHLWKRDTKYSYEVK